MARPGIVIGLGGTGQWVLTWLKRDLLLSNNGEMPKNVRLLAIDTCTRLEAGASRITAAGQKDEAIVVGGVALERPEYVYIGGDARALAQQIVVSQAHGQDVVYPWFHAAEWLNTQSPGMFVLDEGAGRLRQFGRLAIFKDLQGEEAGSHIWSALWTAIEGVRSTTTMQWPLEIIIVGSFAGGTGSGLFIDTALILRLLARKLNVHHILRGMFALPSVFTTTPDAVMKARSFAAWRELNRFMVASEEFPLPEIRYASTNSNFRIQPTQRLFDACYLVDGKRRGQPIAQEAKYGVFPMLAESLSAILDGEAGNAYTQWVYTNLAAEYARRDGIPMYSAIGAYTVQVPASFVQERYRYDFSQEVLLRLLAPEHGPDAQGYLAASGPARHLSLAAPDRNQEDRGFSGRTRSRRLLTQSVYYGGKSAKPTLYHNRIADIVVTEIEQNKRQGLIDALARGGDMGLATWRYYFPSLGDNLSFEAVQKAVNEQMQYNVVQQYRRRDGENKEQARARFKKIPEDLRTRFGGITSSGEEVEEFHGTCGDVLKECEQVQLIIFRQLVQLWLMDILNGHTDDALIARSGKLGYAWDFFDGLVDVLEQFLALMAEVRNRREEVKPEIKLVGLAKKSQDYLNATAGRRIFWFWEHPNVKGSELEYLNAQQRLMEIRREDILHFYAAETARAMKEIGEQTRDAIQRWIWHLTTGDSASQLPGLWDGLWHGRQELNNAHSFDVLSPKVQQSIADKPIAVGEEGVREALELWEWNSVFTGERFTLQVHILPQITTESGSELYDPTQWTSAELRNQVGRANQDALMNLARWRFSGQAAQITAAAEIKREYPDPEKFAWDVADIMAEPLFDGTDKWCASKSNLIRALIDPFDPYFIGANGLEGHLRAINHRDRLIRDDSYGIQIVGSENPLKLTLVRTDDLYTYDTFRAWGLCRDAYQAHIQDNERGLNPILIQNFAAEANALQVERRIIRLGMAYRPLQPRIVTLLEDPVALQQFVYLKMLGDIAENMTPWESHWELTLEKDDRQTFWLTPGWESDTSHFHGLKPDVLSALYGYAVIRKTQQPGHASRIDVAAVQRVINRRLKDLGPRGEIDLLHANLGDAGIVQEIMNLARDPKIEGRILRQDYADLAIVIEFILHDRLVTLKDTAFVRMRSLANVADTNSDHLAALKDTISAEKQEYQVIVRISPDQVSVSQRVRVEVELVPGSAGKDAIRLGSLSSELHCFISSNGLQVLGSEVATVTLTPNNRILGPFMFELQAYLCGDQSYELEVFVEESDTKRTRIYKTSGTVKVKPLKNTTPLAVLPKLDISVLPQADFVLRVNKRDPDVLHESKGALCLSYQLTSRLPGAQFHNMIVGDATLQTNDLFHMRELLRETLRIMKETQAQDGRFFLASLGRYLFDLLFPSDQAAEFRQIFWKLSPRLKTWLIVEDLGISLPWELILPYNNGSELPPLFLGEWFQLGRWVEGLGPPIYSEIPQGEIALAHYTGPLVNANNNDEEIRLWQGILQATTHSHGILPLVNAETPIYWLHLLRRIDQIENARDIVGRQNRFGTSAEEEATKARLDLRRKRPVVTLGILADQDSDVYFDADDWLLPDRALPFLRAGASAVVGPWWPTLEASDRVFWNVFYTLLAGRTPLGEAVWRARFAVKLAVPQRLDWLAYTLFGDPRARAYWPEPSEGYTSLECLNPDDPLRLGKTYRFRASIRSRPPVWHRDRLVQVEQPPDNVRVLFFAPGLQTAFPQAIDMEAVGWAMRQATVDLTPLVPGDYPLVAQFLDGDEHLKTLQLTLKVRATPRQEGS